MVIEAGVVADVFGGGDVFLEGGDRGGECVESGVGGLDVLFEEECALFEVEVALCVEVEDGVFVFHVGDGAEWLGGSVIVFEVDGAVVVDESVLFGLCEVTVTVGGE